MNDPYDYDDVREVFPWFNEETEEQGEAYTHSLALELRGTLLYKCWQLTKAGDHMMSVLRASLCGIGTKGRDQRHG